MNPRFKKKKLTSLAFMKKRLPLILLVLVLLLSAFLRYMIFLGDEGRDVLVVKGILEGNLTFLGPRASAGDFYLGPIYYYMMVQFLHVSTQIIWVFIFPAL
jgi:hypothetical protein